MNENCQLTGTWSRDFVMGLMGKQKRE